MHGIGNDYVYFNCIGQNIENPPEAAKKLSDRHYGIGGDGIVLILPSGTADFRMQMFNADGSEAEMCGNAIRCVGKYVYEKGLTNKDELVIETKAGERFLTLFVSQGIVEKITVDMGEPIFESGRIPVALSEEKVINKEVSIGGDTYTITCVSMGNPHCVIFVEEITDTLVLKKGPEIEVADIFPERINVEFAKIINRNEIDMRVWERGSGETLACGTGASALCVASALNGFTENKVLIHLLGGNLEIEWDKKTNHVYMTGPAEYAFEGKVLIND
jgi:diaminopimelate epimerase